MKNSPPGARTKRGADAERTNEFFGVREDVNDISGTECDEKPGGVEDKGKTVQENRLKSVASRIGYS